MFTVPKAGTPAHVRENCGDLELALTEEDLDELEVAFLRRRDRNRSTRSDRRRSRHDQ